MYETPTKHWIIFLWNSQFLRPRKNNLRRTVNMFEALGNSITEITILVLICIAFGEKALNAIGFIYDKITRKNSPTGKLQKFNEKSKKVSAILEVYREKYSAARTSFFVFHNGRHDIAGIPFLKFSCVDEIIAKGVLPVIHDFQNMHLYAIIDWLDDFLRNENILAKTKELKSESIRAILQMRKTELGIFTPVWNKKELVGFISIEWCSKKYIPENLNSIYSDMDELSKIIEIERYR